MQYSRNDPLEKYGSASRTVTLPIGYWAQVAEICETYSLDFKTALKRAIGDCYKEAQKYSMR